MADAITIDLRTTATVQNRFRLLRIYPLFESIYFSQFHKGKELQIYHVDMDIATLSGGPAFAQISPPTNIVFNYAAPEQIYIRSDNGADQGLDIDVIGEKADGSFGQFTLTSHATNGVTPVDCGTWNFIAFVIKNDAFAGNVIIDDDGVSSTVYWTAPLGATATTGILVVPTGYLGAFLDLNANLLDVPGNANSANVHQFGDSLDFLLNTYTSQFVMPQPPSIHGHAAQSRVNLTAMFEGAAVTLESVHTRFLLWEL